MKTFPVNHKSACTAVNSKPRHIMVLAGEPSGDVHASALVREIKKKDPNARISGMGGMNMEKAGTHLFYSIDKLSAMGLTEILFQLKYIKQAFDEFKNQLRKNRPDLLILIDYPGFNLRAARFAKQRYSIRILYYITPKVWAWNPGRLKQIRAFVDHAALIFPFEEKLYKKAQIPATYVGNPLVDNLSEQNPASRIYDPAGTGLAKEGGIRTIGILPGSRKAEIDKLLEIMLRASRLIHDRDKKTRFLVSCADSVPRDKIEALIAPFNFDGLFKLIPGHPKKIFDRADLLVAASGTVTLEAALCGIPTIIIYKMSFLSYRLARILVRVKYAGLANIISNREVMPELLQEEATPSKISSKALDMMEDLSGCSQRLALVKKLLGSPGASERAARIALDLVK